MGKIDGRAVGVGARIAVAGLAVAALALAQAGAAPAKPRPLYVSLGDSWAVGFQPIDDRGRVLERGGRETVGYDGYLLRRARRQYPRLHLVSLGCGGERSGTMLRGGKPCAKRRPWNGRSPRSSQLAYAERFLRRHRKRVKLVTVVIGGNDIAPCAREPDVVTCVQEGLEVTERNVPRIARRLRAAAGPDVPILGTGYADVVLGEWVLGNPGLAQASVAVFRDLFMPALRRAYTRHGIAFVDVAKDFGTYQPFDRTTTLAPYGGIPRNVATICRLGWYCQANRDIHLKDAGWRRVADLHYRALRRILARQGGRRGATRQRLLAGAPSITCVAARDASRRAASCALGIDEPAS